MTIEQENKDNADNRPPAIWMNDFEDGCVIQRRGKTADIIISGSFVGNPVGIEARAVKHSSNEPVTEWIEIDGAPKERVFMGILPDVPQGGWYRLMVRFKDAPEVMYKSRPRVGVGVLATLIGQSNMKEWFHTGSDHKA